MPGATHARTTRFHLLFRLVLLALVLAIFGRYAWLRLTVMPPLSPDNFHEAVASPRPTSPDDATDEVLRIMAALNTPASFNLPPPPEGTRWSWDCCGPPSTIEVSDALCGDWTPATRPHLQAIIAHLESAAMRARIDELHGLRGRPCHSNFWAWLSGPTGAAHFSEIRGAGKLLAADARYQCEQHGDVGAAWEDIKTVLWLTEATPDDALIALLVRSAHAQLCLSELGHISLQRPIDAVLAADIDRTLAGLTRVQQTWPQAMDGEGRFLQASIDACFTRDNKGNGWLCSSAQYTLESSYRLSWTFGTAGVSNPSRLWNLSSFLYNDRKTVEAKLRRHIAVLSAMSALPYPATIDALEHLGVGSPSFNACDGRVLRVLNEVASLRRAYQVLILGDAIRDGARLMVALNRFKAQRGQYPEALGELVPEFVHALPADPFGGPTFGYRRETPQHYALWCRGANGKDDGGLQDPNRPGLCLAANGDAHFLHPRGEPYWESELVPVDDETGIMMEVSP